MLGLSASLIANHAEDFVEAEFRRKKMHFSNPGLRLITAVLHSATLRCRVMRVQDRQY